MRASPQPTPPGSTLGDPSLWFGLMVTGLGLFLAGFVIFPDGWWHLLAFVLLVAVPWAMHVRLTRGVSQDAWRVRGADVLVWPAVLISFMVATAPFGDGCGPLRWLLLVLDGSGLLVFLSAVVMIARTDGRRAAGWLDVYALVAAAVAVFALLRFYLDPAHLFPEHRLRNPLVYADGLHPVLTGLTFGFGGAIASLRASEPPGTGPRAANDARRPLPPWVWGMAVLVLWGAVFYTHSRGALLAAVGSLCALVLLRRNRRALIPVGVFLAVAAFYQFVGPRFAGAGTPGGGGADPVGHLVDRGAAGRIDLYRHLAKAIDSPREWLIGTGACANDAVPAEVIGWHAHHPHSAYFSLFYHGGVIGLVLFGGVLLTAARGAGRACGRDDGRMAGPSITEVGVLLAFGMVGLLFDGADLYSIVSVPRLEPLLFWFPWALLVARGFPASGSGGGGLRPTAHEGLT